MDGMMEEFFKNIQVPEEMFTDPNAQQQLKDLWQRLEYLSEHDPEEYQKLLAENMKEGKEEFKQEMTAKLHPVIEGTYAFSVEARVTAQSSKKTKAVINFLHHEAVTPPLNKQRVLASPDDIMEWAVIPFSNTSKVSVKKSAKTTIYYDIYVAPVVVQKITSGDRQNRIGLVGYILQQLGEWEKLEFVWNQTANKFIGQYTSNNASPQPHKLSQPANYELYKQAERARQAKVEAETVKTRPDAQAASEITIGETRETPTRAVQIEEINGYEIEHASAEINIHEGDTVLAEIPLPKEANMSNIALDISRTQLQLSGPGGLDVRVKFVSYQVNPHAV